MYVCMYACNGTCHGPPCCPVQAARERFHVCKITRACGTIPRSHHMYKFTKAWHHECKPYEIGQCTIKAAARKRGTVPRPPRHKAAWGRCHAPPCRPIKKTSQKRSTLPRRTQTWKHPPPTPSTPKTRNGRRHAPSCRPIKAVVQNRGNIPRRTKAWHHPPPTPSTAQNTKRTAPRPLMPPY